MKEERIHDTKESGEVIVSEMPVGRVGVDKVLYQGLYFSLNFKE